MTIREGFLGDGNFWEERLPSCVQSKFECLHGCSGHDFLWQLFPERDYSDAKRMLVLHHSWWTLKVWPRSPMRVGAAKTASHGKSRRPCIILYMQIRSPRILLRTRENSCSRWRAVSHGTWRDPFTNFTASFWTLSSAWQSRQRMGEDVCIAHSRCGLSMI